jgi:hypothetical protein
MWRASLVLAVLLAGGCWTKKTDAPSPPEPPQNEKPAARNKTGSSEDQADTKLAITGIEPAKGDSAGGTYVVIKGNRFVADGPRSAKVYFGSRQGSVIRFQSDSEMIVQAPGGKPNETVDLLVIFEPGGQLKAPAAFTFVDIAP